jgi:hypothetical protein
MATLIEVQQEFSKYSVESLISELLRIIRSDSERGYAKHGSIAYCQFIKFVQIEKKSKGGAFKDYIDFFSAKGTFDNKFIEIQYVEKSEPIVPYVISNLLIGESDYRISRNYSFKVDENIVCDFTSFYSNLKSRIHSFHYGDWIDYFQNELNVRDKEINDGWIKAFNNYYDSNLDQDLYSISKENLLNKNVKNLEVKIVKETNPKKTVVKKIVIKKDSVLINEFIKGNRNKNLIISLMGILTKKNIEVNGEGIKYTVSWNHGKRKVTLNKMGAIIYIENKMNKKSEIS